MSRLSPLTWITSIIAVYHLVIVGQAPTWLGLFLPNQIHLAISVSCALILIFTLRRAGARHDAPQDAEKVDGPARVPWYDWILIAMTLASTAFIIHDFENILDYGMFGALDTPGIVFALCLVIPLFEGIRRTTGWALPIIIMTFVLGTIFQELLPGLLYGKGYPLERLLYSAYVGESGIFGLPLNVAGNIVIVFLIFGALMQGAGAGRWFIDIALSLTGWSRGGPAKAAVLSSALFGSISGSPSGNAATTGVFTIPMMKDIGYKPAFAAAVEAVASTGGQILPPVMGAIAFVMAEWLEITYAEVVIAATVPALLYFLIVFVSVHLQAHKDGVAAIPRSQLPRFWPVFIKGWHYLIPIAGLIWFLIIDGYPPGMAAMYSAALIVPSSFLSKNRENWLTLPRIMLALEDGVKRWVVVAAITGSVGIMIGALELSGVGIKLSTFIVDLAGGNLYLALLLVGAASLFVGMGLDAIPAYITLATLMAPALIELGVPDIAAHLFVVYWGLASFYTPPMCIVVYVTIGISGSKVWETGWEAVRLGIAAFLIPFAFALNPALLLMSDLGHIVQATVTAAIGAVLVASGVRGYAIGHLNPVERVAMLAAGILFIAPGLMLPAVGLGIVVVVLGLQRIGARVASQG
ncbi:MAG: TRAP transporter fused permease subunit [Alphaproteobacteria bacterium]|nr:TRAP transporter fused permease subunit [Alphaproteobacteria bacterium]